MRNGKSESIDLHTSTFRSTPLSKRHEVADEGFVRSRLRLNSEKEEGEGDASMDVEGDEEMEDAATLAAQKAAKKIKAAAAGEKSKKKSGGTGEDDDLAAYNLDTYDDEESKGSGKL